jgi:NADH-quinone oxidoreductase subunit C
VTPEIITNLVSGLEGAVHDVSHGQDVVRVPAERWFEFAEAARDSGFEVCVDVTAVDWLRSRGDRYEVVANLLSMKHRARLRMITTLPRTDPTLASLVPLYPGVSFGEREVFDMFGITFAGHPDLTRILMPDDWEGHPLRKDFGVGSVPVQFKESHQVT